SEGLTADAASALELRGRQFNEVVVGHCYLLNYPALRLPIDSCKRSIVLSGVKQVKKPIAVRLRRSRSSIQSANERTMSDRYDSRTPSN
ncbi:MAG TPA: hypothetical protein V6D29_01520, partial [Leptolyngbyaceae cyanobacterium]